MNQKIKTFCAALMIAALTCAGLGAQAQVAEKKTLNLEGAERVIAAVKAEAARLKAPGGVIAVVDDGDNSVAVARLDGTFAAGANISIGAGRRHCSRRRPRPSKTLSRTAARQC